MPKPAKKCSFTKIAVYCIGVSFAHGSVRRFRKEWRIDLRRIAKQDSANTVYPLLQTVQKENCKPQGSYCSAL